MTEEKTIKVAVFNQRVCTYWLMHGIIVLTVIVVGIPFLLIWIPLGLLLTRRYLSRMECVLMEKSLKVKKGMFVRVEKTIPLEKITDLGLVQGPLMRHFKVHCLTVETAGQSMPGALVSLTGIIDVKDFRETVLRQRDTLNSGKHTVAPSEQVSTEQSDKKVLTEIKESLLRIEDLLKK